MPNSEVAIRVENLGKTYLVPQKHANDFTDAPGWRARLKEFFPGLLGADEKDYFWALRDVSFEIKRGETFGIMGQNGSGKSTLLKILSGVTFPTEGKAWLQGRVGSLLEVGTGFHPDLTGRENIFFNGALLGVSQQQIRSKLDEIIEFSGIGKFIDVPVKRYSSGMYVRLAYSVAALLESDIMILDEVLAVGDSRFRAKTEDHIRSATRFGKTVIIVSHSPQAVAQICNRGIILHQGRVVFAGDAQEIVAEYLASAYAADPDETKSDAGEDGEKEEDAEKAARRRMVARSFVDISKSGRMTHPEWPDPSKVLKWISIHKLSGERSAEFKISDGIRIRIGFDGIEDLTNRYFCVYFQNSANQRMITAHSTHTGKPIEIRESGVVECVIDSLMLGRGMYSLMLDTGTYDFETGAAVSEDCVPFATFVKVMDDGGVFKGIGLVEFQGAAHMAAWDTVQDDDPERPTAKAPKTSRAKPTRARRRAKAESSSS